MLGDHLTFFGKFISNMTELIKMCFFEICSMCGWFSLFFFFPKEKVIIIDFLQLPSLLELILYCFSIIRSMRKFKCIYLFNREEIFVHGKCCICIDKYN